MLTYHQIITSGPEITARPLGDYPSAQQAADAYGVPCDHRIVASGSIDQAVVIWSAGRAAIQQQCSVAGRSGVGSCKRRSAEQCRAAARARRWAIHLLA